ncbi:MAG: hypothetical protein ABIH08_01990 [Candidatus Omnitrophota bacterium]
MNMKGKFMCQKCRRNLSFWKIITLGFRDEKKLFCECGEKIFFKENYFLRLLPTLCVPMYLFLKKEWYILVPFSFFIAFLLGVYSFSLKRK